MQEALEIGCPETPLARATRTHGPRGPGAVVQAAARANADLSPAASNRP